MPNNSEQCRHECEVRQILNLDSMQKMAEYMDKCEKVRGKKAANRLRDDVRAALIEQRKNKNGGKLNVEQSTQSNQQGRWYTNGRHHR